MFGFLRGGLSSKLRVMVHDVDVVSISHNGEILYTADIVQNYPTDHMEGQLLEVAITTRSGNAYFVYYLCPDYYMAMAVPLGAAAFGGPEKTELFRSTVSQQIAVFLIQYLQKALQIDARLDIASFSHNMANTNVLAYVTSLSAWYAIQHNDSEGDDATERKVEQVNRGQARITDFIAVDEMSPNAAGV